MTDGHVASRIDLPPRAYGQLGGVGGSLKCLVALGQAVSITVPEFYSPVNWVSKGN